MQVGGHLLYKGGDSMNDYELIHIILIILFGLLDLIINTITLVINILSNQTKKTTRSRKMK